MKKFILILIAALSLTATAQSTCTGSFLIYNHYGYFGNGFDCWSCGYNYLPVVAIRVDSSARWYYLYLSVKDTAGNRLWGAPSSIGGGGVTMGIAYFNNTVFWGTIAPHWMGVTSSSWYWGRIQYVGVIGASYQTSCFYQGDLMVTMKAKTYIPGVGDTCYYDSTARVPSCNPLGFNQDVPQPEPITESPKRVINTYDITGRTGPSGQGITILQFEDGSYKKVVKLNQ